MDPLTELLKLYCDHSTQAIEAADGKLLLDAFGVTQPDALVAIPGYPEAFAMVSECSSIVDSLAAKHPAPDEQVHESLRTLRRMVDDGDLPKKVDTACALVECRLRKAWPPTQQAVYDQKKHILEWRDFFVSYTNRDAPATNQQFRDLIKSCLGSVPTGTQQLQVNYLARVITRHLRRYQQLSGFFDEDNLQVGENIHDAVDGYCTKAFALVQLIEPLTFDKEPPRNWCFHEYKCFSENAAIVGLLGNKDRHFFILTDPLGAIQPASLFPPFAGWVKRMEGLKHVHIALKDERNTTLRAKIKDIATQILALRSEVIDRWLT
jgi:hypothetical protein